MSDASTMTKCGEEGCHVFHLGSPPGNEWAWGFEPHGRVLRFCPAHSTAEYGAVVQPSPFELLPAERAAFEAGAVETKQFLGITLQATDVQFRDAQGQVMLIVAAPMPPVLHVFRSKLIGPDGQPIVTNVPMGLPPAIRLVVPRTAVIDGALKEADEARDNPRKIRPTARA